MTIAYTAVEVKKDQHHKLSSACITRLAKAQYGNTGKPSFWDHCTFVCLFVFNFLFP